MTKFKKGNKMGKGRKAGSTNKVTQDIRKTFEDLLNDNVETMQNDLDSLESLDRLKMMTHLASFVIPKLKSVDISNVGDDTIQISFDEPFNIRDLVNFTE